MAAKASPTSAATPVAAGVRTPATGVYSDPAQVGAMIQKMYSQYANFDPVTLGQRWIDVHTPTPSTAGVGAGTDVLQAPIGTTPTTSTDPNQNTPDLSGLSKFATPVSQQPVNQQPQAPLLGNGVIQNNSSGSSAGLAAPKPKTPPKPAPSFSVPQVLPTPTASQKLFGPLMSF